MIFDARWVSIRQLLNNIKTSWNSSSLFSRLICTRFCHINFFIKSYRCCLPLQKDILKNVLKSTTRINLQICFTERRRRYLVTKVISTPHVKRICAIREYFAESWIKLAGIPPCHFRRKSEIVSYREQELLLNIPFKSLNANGIIEKPVTEDLQKIPANSIYCLVSIICLKYVKSCY